MGIGNILWHQYIFFVANGTLFVDHFYTTSACLVCRFHNPKSIFISILTKHLESIEIEREYISSWNEIVGLRVSTSLFVEIFPHIVFSAQLPTAWEMIHFLVSVHNFQSFLVNARDIKEHIPFGWAFWFSKSIKLEWVYDASVLRPSNFIFQVGFL